MKSAMPKVLHPVAGRPLLSYPIRAALEAGCEEVVVVVGHGRDAVEAYLAEAFGSTGRVRTAVQLEQRGTGDAARAGLRHVSERAHRVLVYYGDVPLLSAADLAPIARALDEDPAAAIAIATCVLDDPTGYGRVLRDALGQIVEIREHRDLRTDTERATREMNPGIYALGRTLLADLLDRLSPNNAQGEFYLTDIVAMAAGGGRRVLGVPSRAEVIEGVNDRVQLAAADRAMIERIVDAHRRAGVTVHDGARIEDGIRIGRDALIESHAVLREGTEVGEGARVGVGAVLTAARVAPFAVIKPYAVVTQASVGERAEVGPLAHLRPESVVGQEAHVGNFVELKKTVLERGAKANHLAYLGDGFVGEGANVGAGTIFCNYDGFSKHVTRIEAGAFIGSDSQLVAPVTIGKNAYVATGTTVTRDVPEGALAIARVKQENKEGYADRLRARLSAAKAAAKKD